MRKKSQRIIDLEACVKATAAQLKKQKKLLAFAKQHAAFLDTLKCRTSFYSDTFDFDYPTHSDAVKIMQYFRAGKWSKRYSESKVTYAATLGDMGLRLYEGALPPHCRVITETVTVPERIIPEHVEEKTRIVCNEDENIDQPTTEAAAE